MRIALWAILFCVFTAEFGISQELKVETQEDGYTVTVDGKLFARYLTQGRNKPVIWPIVGPTGKEMTRAYPFKENVEGEKKDHVHHESFWFDHGSVNGIDFWAKGENAGVIKHVKTEQMEQGKTALLVTKNDWMAGDKRICEDTRWIRFSADDKARWIDFEVEIAASEGELKFGETKEGSFGIRVPTSMDVESKIGGVIVNSEGQKDAEAWGKPAAWVDYSGPVGDETLGIAILNHPSSFRFPTTWHVRTYGLFAANPFGGKDFKAEEAKYGPHVIPPGGKMHLAFRVIFHQGDAQAGGVAEAFKAYSESKPMRP